MEQSLRAELVHARNQTDRLFDLIGSQTLYARPIAERHRLIFYLGHFEAFDWNVLARRALGASSFHPEFDSLFERGIDPEPGKAPQDAPGDWPKRDEVSAYVSKTRQWIDDHLESLEPALLQMAIEHRQMHAETFAYLLHNLPADEKRAPAGEPPALSRKTASHQTQLRNTPSRDTPKNPMIDIAAGTVTLGKSRDGFGWDNEHLAHEVFVPACRISKFKISNGEYLDFVREGGPVPHFWTREGNAWLYRGMFEVAPLQLNAPVWVTWKQAAAYAKWRGLALPTEAQWQRAAMMGDADPIRDNFGFVRWDPIAVDAGCTDRNGSRTWQMTGNGWEWTNDVFAPFDGFTPHPFYPGYSADFFDGQHYVMKGASPRTAALLTRPTFRNWFRPDYPYMYAGFRLVEN